MLLLPNFKLNPGGKLSDKLLAKGITTFHKAVHHVHQLPYGRNTRPANYWTIIHEGKGTCSSKHAYLKALSDENNIFSMQLLMCIYTMDKTNTPAVGTVLEKYQMEYILEAHNCLSYGESRFDFTFPDRMNTQWESGILSEEYIDPDQIGDYKKEYHQSMLEEWIKRNAIPYTLEQIWDIREECIAAIRALN